jgi:hypothetical protein
MRGHVTEGRRSLEEGKYVEGDRLGTLIGNGKVPERLVRAVYLKGAFDADVLVGPVVEHNEVAVGSRDGGFRVHVSQTHTRVVPTPERDPPIACVVRGKVDRFLILVKLEAIPLVDNVLGAPKWGCVGRKQRIVSRSRKT